jgi:tRNA dimethylallyltransferase
MIAELSKKPVAIIIAGPTASGKTSLAIRVAEHFSTSIISADSRQCYHELNIGVARPGPNELQKIRHYFIDNHSVTENVHAAVFESEGMAAADEIFQHNSVVVVTGGTGLYMKTFCEGIDEIPPVDPATRNLVRKRFTETGLSFLQQWLNEVDPDYFRGMTEKQNPVRLLRALEVKLSTGNSISHYQNRKIAERPFRIIKAGIHWSREILYQRINERVDKMMAHGLVEEARSLLPFREYNALHTVGYQELFQYFDGLLSLKEATDKIKQHTRNYAKRQMTWFAKDKEITWFSGDQTAEVISFLENAIRI